MVVLTKEKMEQPRAQGQPSQSQDPPAGLAAESYEFIARSMDMQRALRQAFESLELKPESTSEEIHEVWRGGFEQVYDNLFAMFLRPMRLTGLPLDWLTQSKEATPPNRLVDAYLGWLKLVGKTPERHMRAMSNAFSSSYQGGNVNRADEDVTGHTSNATPVNLLQNMVDEGAKVYVETFDLMVSYFGENQSVLPRQLFSTFHEALAIYPKRRLVAKKYEAMLHDTWQKSLSRFAAEVKRQPTPMVFKVFFKTYLTVFSDEFSRLMASKEFVEAQNAFANVNSDSISAQRRFMQAQLDLFPFLPVATKDETDTLAERLHSYKTRSDALERKVRVLEAKLKTLAESHPAGPGVGITAAPEISDNRAKDGARAVAAAACSGGTSVRACLSDGPKARAYRHRGARPLHEVLKVRTEERP